MRLAFIILAHRDPEQVARLALRLAAAAATVVVHYDLKAGAAEFAKLRASLQSCPAVLLAERVDVAWGQWSMVRATLNGIEALQTTGLAFDYVHLMSGMDYPIRPIRWLSDFLRRHNGTEFIEVANIRDRTWVRGGLEHERYQYKHIHNWQTQRKQFDRFWKRQQARKRKRDFLPGFDPHLGSQWWTLTWATCLGALEWSRDRAVEDFFSTVWIPDEIFFQTFVGNKIPRDRVMDLSLTLHEFDNLGLPIVYYNDHFDYLIRQDFFFVRKVSPSARSLRDRIDRHLAEMAPGPAPSETRLGWRKAELAATLERHGEGLVNRRRVAYAIDPWYGDLEWNRDNYIVIATPHRAGAEPVREALAALDFTICHGELFAADRIEFAGDAERFAGFGARDLKLRDHNRANFLVDVIKFGAPALTCFVWVLDGKNEMHEILVWDPRAHFVFVQTDVLETFMQWRWQRSDSGGDPEARSLEASDEALEFASFSRDFLSRAGHWHLLRKNHQKRPHVITTLDGNWEGPLSNFARTSFNGSDPQPNEQEKTTVARPGRYDISADAGRKLRLIQVIDDAWERDRRIVADFRPTQSDSVPYILVLLPPGFETIVAALGLILPRVECLSVADSYDAGPADEGLAGGVGSLEPCRISCGRYQLSGVGTADTVAVVKAIVRDPRSAVLVIRDANDPIRPVPGGFLEVSAVAREQAQRNGKRLWDVDLGRPQWFAALVDFVAAVAGTAPNADEVARLAAFLDRQLGGSAVPGAHQISPSDFRWALRPCIVVASTSRATAARVMATLGRFQSVVCHGELFDSQRIGFVGGAAAYGGYSATETKRRDSDVALFLNHMIAAAWPSVMAFPLVVAAGHKEIERVPGLACDPRTQFIVVGIDVIEEFIAGWPTAERDAMAAGAIDVPSFEVFAARSLAQDAALRGELKRELAAAGKGPLPISLADDAWIGRLRRFVVAVRGSATDDEVTLLTGQGAGCAAPVVPHDLAIILKLAAAIPDQSERVRHLNRYFGPAPNADRSLRIFLVLSYADERIAKAVARAVPELEPVIVHYRLGFSRSPQPSDGSRQPSVSIECRDYRVEAVDVGDTESLLSLFAAKPGARMLSLRGNALAPLLELLQENGNYGDPVHHLTTEALKSNLSALIAAGDDFVHRFRTVAAEAGKSAAEFDLLTPNWLRDLTSFLVGSVDQERPTGIDRRIADVVAQELSALHDPADSFDDPLSLTEAIVPPARRLAHLRILHGRFEKRAEYYANARKGT
jgi:hypothetical protein